MAVKHIVGNQTEMIFATLSREEVKRKTAVVTSQLASMPRRKTWCHLGVTTLPTAIAMASVLNAPDLKMPPSEVRLAEVE